MLEASQFATRAEFIAALRGGAPVKPKLNARPTHRKQPADKPKSVGLPCNHRGGEIGSTKCGTCGSGVSLTVFHCNKHGSCTIARQSDTDKNIRVCETCPDRCVASTFVEFESYMNKCAGKTATIVGRGETTFPNSGLAALDGPILFINDAVQLESFCPDNPNTFMFGRDKCIASVLPNMRSIAVVPQASDLGFEIRHTQIPMLGTIMWTVQPQEGNERLLKMSREQLKIERRLYLSRRETFGLNKWGPSPTICQAIHFAWYLGCDKVRLIRCDGLPTGYAKDLDNVSQSPENRVGKYARARFDAEHVMTTLGMQFEYVGTPPVIVAPVPEQSPAVARVIDFFTTSVDVPGRESLMERTYASFKENLHGIDFGMCRLFLNVDHVHDGVGPDALVAVAKRYFGEVIVNASGRANFAAAWRWCASQPQTEWAVGLEDDWILVQPVHIDALTAMLNADPHLACVNIRAYPFSVGDKRICLSPGLWRTAHAKTIANRMTDEANPESQLRNASRDNPHGGKHNGFIGQQFPPDDKQARMVVDIGREWMRGTKYRRPVGTHFVEWMSAV